MLFTDNVYFYTHTHTRVHAFILVTMEERRIEVLQPLLRAGHVTARCPMTVTMLPPDRYTAWVRDPATGERVQCAKITIELDPVENKEWNDETQDEIPTKEKVVDAMFELANQVVGWDVPKGFISEIYDKYDVAAKGGVKAQIDELGDQIRRKFHMRFREYYGYSRLDNSVFPANAAERFIRRVNWWESVKLGMLAEDNGIMLRR